MKDTHVYANPWAKPFEPQEYRRTVEPIDHAGAQIFRVCDKQYDVVKGGTCITQRAGLSGAKLAAESVADLMFPTFHDVRERMLERRGIV